MMRGSVTRQKNGNVRHKAGDERRSFCVRQANVARDVSRRLVIDISYRPEIAGPLILNTRRISLAEAAADASRSPANKCIFCGAA